MPGILIEPDTFELARSIMRWLETTRNEELMAYDLAMSRIYQYHLTHLKMSLAFCRMFTN